jgi:hypothetical protein
MLNRHTDLGHDRQEKENANASIFYRSELGESSTLSEGDYKSNGGLVMVFGSLTGVVIYLLLDLLGIL